MTPTFAWRMTRWMTSGRSDVMGVAALPGGTGAHHLLQRVAVVEELSFGGGDAAFIYEGFGQ